MDGHANGIASAGNQRVIDASPPRVAPRVAVFRIHAEIPHDTHDLIPRVVPVLLGDVAKAPADRVVASEHHLRERLVHDDGPGAGLQIAGVKRTAGEDRRVQHVEEVQSDRRRRHPTVAGIPACRRGASLVDVDLTRWVIHQGQHAGDRDSRDAGFALESSLELLGRGGESARERRVGCAGHLLAIHRHRHSEILFRNQPGVRRACHLATSP
jgi:hypothetical protein